MVSLLERHNRVCRTFALSFGLLLILVLVVLGCALVNKQKTDEVLAFNVAAQSLNENFERVTLTFRRLYTELTYEEPSLPYLASLQGNFVEGVSALKQSIAILGEPTKPFFSTQEDLATQKLLQDVTPKLRVYIARVEAVSSVPTVELKARFSAPSVVDLSAARNGSVRQSLDTLTELARTRQTKVFRFLSLFMLTALATSLVLLIGSWVWLIKPALSNQRKTLISESEFARDLELRNAELSQSETRARLLYEDAMKGTRARTEFLAVVSHELRTPLNAVIGYSEVMKLEMYGEHSVPAYREYANNIYSGGKHLLSIVDDILEFSRFESGKLELRDSDLVPVTDITDELWQLIRNKADAAGIRLVLNDAGCDIALKVDRRLLLQALMNLTDNAIKFSEPGDEVIVALTLPETGELSLSVTDSGLGIDLDKATKLLEPFEQVAGAFNRSSQGLGLGLAITNNIVKAHGGRIVIESALGQGSKFSIILPKERVRVAALDKQASNAA